MSRSDLDFVVAAHREFFPDGFFARLGPGFLTAYSRTYLTSAHARAYVADVDGRPAGFLVGVLDPAAHRRHVVRSHGVRLLARAVAGMVVRPRVASHFVRTRLFRYLRKLAPKRRGAAASPSAGSGVTAVLSHVAVVGSARSLGLGGALIRVFAGDAAHRGCARISLVTLAGPGGAGPYYERLGWLPRGETRTAEGRQLATYDLPLTSRPTQGPAQ
ncbi:GNAT family N-acetyltransferase [Streptomyces radicis]|uniref:GNAT family N-acetyltransferase n=1 Tax=Streptomyces radicis TaxID=1750517 RepID=A0A3A9WA07_9ACTN|nr:GNAT family N-acetyltransferase [Streptomyces radicis]RKN10121.1 GNAT family N-acetyltransferase [Streptomyces radicis]RKN24463.1 GNAT family N-acetyltransferase [Streptomyces radicis]